MDKIGHSRLKGTPLVAAITSVCSLGFWLFGYDQGVMSGVVISQPWLKQMGNPSTVMIGTITSLYDIGAALGAIAAASSSERLGRKQTLIFGAIILIIGSVLMGSAFERIQMMVARVITGIGIGYITSVTPVYQSEISLAEHRGWLVCCQLTSMPGGLMLAYWMNYGFYFHSSSAQWRFPLLFQCIFAIYVIAVTLWLPETPRWLMRHDATPDRGTTVLAKLRGVSSDHPVVQQERTEILDAIAIEAKEESSWSDLFKDHGIRGNKRFYLALGIQFMQQMTGASATIRDQTVFKIVSCRLGINIVTYYAPTLFQQSLGMSQERALFVGCFLQVWYLFASFVTWYTIDRVGRRKLWISMAYGQCLVLILEAICVKLNTPRASIGAVFLIFVYEACFTWGWMATVWIYPPEILPLKLRAKGAALAAAADFLGNFVVVQITPPALRNIGYKTYIIFAVFNFVNAYIVWAFYPETAGLTLESVDDIFRRDDEPADSRTMTTFGLQWSIVGKAAAAVKRVKRNRTAGVEGAVQSGIMTRKKESDDGVESGEAKS
ncbi:major facilitator superfamily domain-containing protein [Boletus edulis BED1]|uniref:Major facilitator superfamily domain-containing protein n=1 Tax=Boletus edulis BED1 TaxID=1328754 RepID=A0AAD4BQ38_BOLED|nr:major facilitator superfamily domain-containing protein [Boletus edulis BED1]